MTQLELDHVFAAVTDPEAAVARLEADGWTLDAGQEHAGQGTRNRRLRWPGMFFELVWVADEAEAARSVLRFDLRADAATSGFSPFGIAFRGTLAPRLVDSYWLYDALGPRIWIHRDQQHRPERPMVLVLETSSSDMLARRRLLTGGPTTPMPGEGIQEIRLGAPSRPSLPPYLGPQVTHREGPHRLEIVVDHEGAALEVSPGLVIRR